MSPTACLGVPARLGRRAVVVLKVFCWLLALLPFARLFAGALMETLGANPVEFLTRSTGTWTMVFLCIALAVTPVRKLTGWQWLAQFRRLMGLFAFFYAACHFATFLWFEHFFDVNEMLRDVVKRPFITMGFAAFVLLLPLVATSTARAARALGAARWRNLHRLVYVVAPLGVLHYWWHKAGKNDFAEPLVYAVVVAILLGARAFDRLRSSGS